MYDSMLVKRWSDLLGLTGLLMGVDGPANKLVARMSFCLSGVLHQKRVMEKPTFEKGKKLLCKQVFMLTWGGFWIRWKRVNVQVGRWKHICWIYGGIENVELTVLTSYLCWCRPFRFLITRGNVAGSNNNRCADQWGDPNPKWVISIKEVSLLYDCILYDAGLTTYFVSHV